MPTLLYPDADNAMIGEPVWANLGGTLAQPHRIYLCGRLVVSLHGHRVEDAMPGRQGRLTFAHLVVNRGKAVERDELIESLWGDATPSDPESALSAILSKLRRVISPARLEGRSTLRLELPDETWIDLDAASEALHRAPQGKGYRALPEVPGVLRARVLRDRWGRACGGRAERALVDPNGPLP